jgi:capsular polysaccharide biosynthesis protein
MSTLTDHRTNSRPGDYPPSLAHPPSPLQAVARHPLIALLPVILLIGAAIAVSTQRKPTYSAESRVAIGSFSPSEQSAPGAAYAGTQFASAYSRAITAEDVVRPVARETHLAPAQVSARLSATPVPDSPFLRIQATGPTAQSAEALASAATGALTEYVRRSGATNAQATRLLQRFHDAQAKAESAATAASRAKKDVDQSPNDASARNRLEKAQTNVETTSLKARGLRAAYLEQAQSSTSGIPVRVLNDADSATSDAEQKLRLILTVAAAAGIALGVALATAVASRRWRRELPRL